jgi:CubicO group peptidase (beta-lactamase class C family)
VVLGGLSHAEDTPKQRASAVLEAAARDGFSGTVCIESGGATLVDRAFGWADDRHSRRVDPDTLYHVASVTKLVTAIAVLKLAEQHKLALANPLGKWFPEAPADKAAITIEQLLLHQSGLGQNYAADGIASREAAVRAVVATALSFPPGTAQKYSNDGMNLVAAVIEKASGRSYRDFVHDEILAPAGLKRSLLWEEVNPRKTQNLAVPAADAAAGPAPGRNWGLMGGDGLWSNARELARLMRAVVGGRILWIRGTEQNGFNAALYWYPDADLILAITTNLGPFESGRVTVSRALANRLEQALLPARAPDASGRAQHQDRVRAAEAERVGQR